MTARRSRGTTTARAIIRCSVITRPANASPFNHRGISSTGSTATDTPGNRVAMALCRLVDDLAAGSWRPLDFEQRRPRERAGLVRERGHAALHEVRADIEEDAAGTRAART